MTTPYQKLTDSQKKVTFHVDGSRNDPVRHSGILPSGEGNFYDDQQVLRNDNIHDGTSGKILRGSPSNRSNDPTGEVPAALQPDGLRYNNVSISGEIYNQEIAQGALMPRNFNGISNAERYPPQTYVQGPYIHYYNGSTGLLPDSDGAIEYFAGTGLTATSGGYYPYGGGPS